MSGLNFDGKVVLVTGASSGIGAETARLFSEHGALLSLTGRNEANLKAVGESCRGQPLLIPADLSKDEDIQKIVELTISKYERLDVLVNNAGIYEIGGIKNSGVEQFDRIMNVNMRSVFVLTKLAVPHLLKTKGNIVNVSSIAGTRTFANGINYSVSKAALDQFTKCTALELAPDGIRVNAVNPGTILTPILYVPGLKKEEVDEYIEASKDTHPLGRVGVPREVADAIVFLASEMAAFITGANVPVDGGRHVTCLKAVIKK